VHTQHLTSLVVNVAPLLHGSWEGRLFSKAALSTCNFLHHHPLACQHAGLQHPRKLSELQQSLLRCRHAMLAYLSRGRQHQHSAPDVGVIVQ